jgi:hypothetical protein
MQGAWKSAVQSASICGWGQYRNGQKTKAAIFVLSEFVLLGLGLLYFFWKSTQNNLLFSAGNIPIEGFDPVQFIPLLLFAAFWLANVIDAYMGGLDDREQPSKLFSVFEYVLYVAIFLLFFFVALASFSSFGIVWLFLAGFGVLYGVAAFSGFKKLEDNKVFLAWLVLALSLTLLFSSVALTTPLPDEVASQKERYISAQFQDVYQSNPSSKQFHLTLQEGDLLRLEYILDGTNLNSDEFSVICQNLDVCPFLEVTSNSIRATKRLNTLNTVCGNDKRVLNPKFCLAFGSESVGAHDDCKSFCPFN